MKKILVLSATLICLLMPGKTTKYTNENLVESTEDLLQNNVGLKLNKAIIGENEEIKYSQTFVQYGKDDEGKYVLRFATAVKGDIAKLTYKRSIEGLNDREEEISTVYYGILAENQIYYFDGENITTDESYKSNYYWACYTIKFETNTYKSKNITAGLFIEDKAGNQFQSLSKTASLNSLLPEKIDATIDQAGEYIAEAESLDPTGFIAADDFIAAGAISSKENEYCVRSDTYASNGKYICGSVSKDSGLTMHFELKEDATISISAVARAGIGINFSAESHVLFYLDEEKLTNIENKSLSSNEGKDNKWVSVKLADNVKLTKGTHTLRYVGVNFGSFDLDCFKINVLKYGNIDTTIDRAGEYTVEAESLDPTGFIAADDFISLGAISSKENEYCIRNDSYASNGKYICGFASNGSSITTTFQLKEDATVSITAIAKAGIGINFSAESHVVFHLDGEKLSNIENKSLSSRENEVNKWVDVKLVSNVKLAKGIHTLKLTTAAFGNFDLDKFNINVLKYGKIDATIDQAGEYIAEAESLDPTGFIAADDFIAAGAISSKENEYCVRSDTYASNGKYICGSVSKDSGLTMHFELKEDATISISAVARAGIGINFSAESHVLFYLDEEKLTNIENKSLSSNEGKDNKWVSVKLADNVKLTKGTHTLRYVGVNFGSFDLDCFKINVM